jgi:hypothetical protein
MLAEKEKLQIYLERAKRDLEDEKERSQELQKKMLDQDMNVNDANDKLRS